DAFDSPAMWKFYSSLKHPELASQLREYIADAALNVVVRRMAIEIAGDCKLSELTSDFLALLQSESDPTIRRCLAHSLRKMTPAHRAKELIPLAKGEIGLDTDDNLKECALHVLIHNVWSVAEALPFLLYP